MRLRASLAVEPIGLYDGPFVFFTVIVGNPKSCGE
jgi:hypothetical protein